MIHKLTRINSRAFYETFSLDGCPITLAAFPETEYGSFEVALCTQPKLSPEKMLSTFHPTPDFLSNGSFFETATGDSIFNLVSNGSVFSQSDLPSAQMGVGVPWPFSDGPIPGLYKSSEWLSFLTAYPMLFQYGFRKDVSGYRDIDYLAQRMVFGQFRSASEEKWYFFFLVEGSGCRLATLQNMLSKTAEERNGMVLWAANLDGGGSAYLAVEGKRVSEGEQGDWVRPVDNVIAVYLRDMESGPGGQEDKPSYWRVSLGAFSIRENAESYLQTIRSLGVGVVDYSKAFLSYDEDGPFYRVQVGAFSNRSGAEKVAQELRSLGYDTYVRYGM